MRIANLGYNGKQIKYTIVDNDEVTKYTAIIGFMDSDYTVGRLTLSQFEGEGENVMIIARVSDHEGPIWLL